MNGFFDRHLILFCLWIGLTLAREASGVALAQDLYVWPLDEPRSVTSTFGDYRPGHFHSGIDLSTGGREGLPVRAADSGRVWRVRTSFNGYGKAVYVRLVDGRLAVYAHLSRFAPRIQRAVAAAQIERGQYEVEIWPGVEDLPVERGEVIGYTGQTGAGPPHLHFELRDEEERPLNPLTHGVSVDDTVAPVLSRLIVRPLDFGSLVNGSGRDLEITLVWDAASGLYAAQERPLCAGRVGLLVEGRDHTTGSHRSLSVYAFSLRVDGAPVFRTRFQEFGYEETDRIDTHYDLGEKRARKREFHRLYRAKGNCLPFGNPYGEWAGVIDSRQRAKSPAAPGLHEIEITAEDAAGNASRARLALVVDERPVIGRVEIHPGDRGTEVRVEARDPDDGVASVEVVADVPATGRRVSRSAESAGGDWFRAFLPGVNGSEGVVIRTTAVDRWGHASVPEYRTLGNPDPGSDGGPILVGLKVGPTRDHLEIAMESPSVLGDKPKVWSPDLGWGVPEERIEQVGIREYCARVPLTREFDGRITVRAAARDVAGRVLEGEAEAEIWNLSPEGGGRVHDPGWSFGVRVEPGQVFEDTWLRAVAKGEWDGVGEILPSGPVFLVEPADAVLHGKVTVTLRSDGTGPAATRAGICSPQADAEWEWVGGEFDGSALRVSVPYLTRFCVGVDETPPQVGIVNPKDGSRLSRRESAFRATASDRGSGVDCFSVGMNLDGRPLIVEFDPELGVMASVFAEPLVPGPHALVVRAVDRAGNPSEARSTFWVD